MFANFNNSSPSFSGTTKVYAISDSHQETRKTSGFLSQILKETKNDDNVLFLNNGDMFKGIYPRELERDCYVKMKEAKPDMEMVFTLGNNDFGFNKESLDYLVDTVKTFSQKGIHTVCANIFDKDGKRPEWVKPYTVVERDGDKTFVTGFCIDNINTAKFGIFPKKQKEVLDEIKAAIVKEKPDNVIILNHDYMPSSKSIVEDCKKNGINVDVVIGGHDHDRVAPDKDLNIYYPQSFSESMYKMKIENYNNTKTVSDVEEVANENIPLSNVFAEDIEDYESESGLLESIAPHTLNLVKRYSTPCPLGSFLADEMMKTADADVGFFSTGFLMRTMNYQPNKVITNYDFKKTMVAETPIKTAELSVSELKQVFDNAMKQNGYGMSNAKFLQCSNNIRIEGSDNPKEQHWDVKQIYINDEPLLDEDGHAISDKKFKCVMDSYIADGGQGYSMIQAKDKQDVVKNGKSVLINEVLINGLKEAPNKYEKGSEYPCFSVVEV